MTSLRGTGNGKEAMNEKTLSCTTKVEFAKSLINDFLKSMWSRGPSWACLESL